MAKCVYCGAEVEIGELCVYCGSRAEPYLYPDVHKPKFELINNANVVGYGDGNKRSRRISLVYKILADSLNVRYEPTLCSRIVSHVHKGESFTITEIANCGRYNWGRLKSGVGWICLKYAVPIDTQMYKQDDIYIIQHGDSLLKILKQFYGFSDLDTASRLAKYNGIRNPDKIKVGKELKIPFIGKII